MKQKDNDVERSSSLDIMCKSGAYSIELLVLIFFSAFLSSPITKLSPTGDYWRSECQSGELISYKFIDNSFFYKMTQEKMQKKSVERSEER